MKCFFRDPETAQFMGLQLIKPTTLCHKKAFMTNTKNIYVLMNDTLNDKDKWYIGAEEQVDASQINPYSHVR